MESLFSLEVIINYLKLNLNQTNCLFPSIAFRLLDYPTIAINLLDEYDSKDLKTRLNLNESIKSIEKLPCFKDLLDKHDRYIFSKGKSCLFRADLEQLRSFLSITPLYLMILDTFYEPYKLIGTVLVPLTNLINEIYNETIDEAETTEQSVNRPCIKMTHGVFEIKNLMGTEIGHVSFACRMTSFGKSLLPHMDKTTESVQRKLQQEATKPIKEIPLNKKLDSSKKNADAVIQTVSINYQDAQIQINSNTYETKDFKDKLTQFPGSNRKSTNNKKPSVDSNIEDDFSFNHYCPPALHYNSELKSKNPSSNSLIKNVINENNFISKRVEYLKHAVESEELLIEEFEEETKPEPENFIEYSAPKPEKIEAKTNQISFDQIPLLKCLFDEVTKLKNMLESPNQISSFQIPAQPSKKPISKPKQSASKPISILRKKSSETLNRDKIIESVNRLSQPKTQIVTSKPPIYNEYDEIPVKGPKEEPIKKETKKKPPLKYGLTNTHRMRVLASRPNRAQQIELKHEHLGEKIKQNLDDFNLSSATSFDQNNSETIRLHKNLEKVLFFESTGSLTSGTVQTQPQPQIPSRNLNSLKNTNGSNKSMPNNLTLLNKVEMESTFDTMNYLNTKLEQEFSLNQQNSITKMVQFGNTYVYNTSAQHSSESGGQNSHSTNSSSNKDNEKNTDKNRSSIDESSYSRQTSTSNKNIFLKKENNYEDDFLSSVESTLTSSKNSNPTTSSNFITANLKKYSPRDKNDFTKSIDSNELDDYDEDLLGKINQSDLKSSSKFSNSIDNRSYNTKSFLDDDTLSSINKYI